MTVKIGINGFGRIGRNFTRAVLAQGADVEIVAVSNLTGSKTLAHLLKYDSILDKLDKDVTYAEDSITMGGKTIKAFEERDPAKLPWGKLEVDIVVELADRFTGTIAAKAHLDAGTKKVIILAPAKNGGATFVIGVSEQNYDPKNHDIISSASCTTNYLAPLAKVLNDEFGIVRSLMTAIHTYTAGQNPQNSLHKDLRRARAATLNIVPTETGAAQTVTLVPPELRGKSDGYALRIPTPTGSVTGLTFEAKKPVIMEFINAAVKAAAEGPLEGILTYTEGPIISKGIRTDLHSLISGSGLTEVIGNQMKVTSWYNDEWGHPDRLVDLARLVGSKL